MRKRPANNANKLSILEVASLSIAILFVKSMIAVTPVAVALHADPCIRDCGHHRPCGQRPAWPRGHRHRSIHPLHLQQQRWTFNVWGQLLLSSPSSLMCSHPVASVRWDGHFDVGRATPLPPPLPKPLEREEEILILQHLLEGNVSSIGIDIATSRNPRVCRSPRPTNAPHIADSKLFILWQHKASQQRVLLVLVVIIVLS